MHPILRGACAVLLLAGLAPATRPAQAETYQTCAGFIDSLPATLTTQGVWCLRKDLGTAMASGAAITIAANNVTIDCNDFKLGGLAAGAATQTRGIQAAAWNNATVRNCNIRGFLYGASLYGGSGHAVLDSRFDGNTLIGIYIGGDGAVVRGNRILETGGTTLTYYTNTHGLSYATGMTGTIVDNVVQGVHGISTGGQARGISVSLSAGEVARNSVSDLQPTGGSLAYGIHASAANSRLMIRDNLVSMPASTPIPGYGVVCYGAIARNNTVSGMVSSYYSCTDAGGNFAN